MVPAARRMHVGIVPYFPLASGMLTGKYKRGEDFPEGSRFAFMSYFASVANDENFDRIEALANSPKHVVTRCSSLRSHGSPPKTGWVR